MQVADICERVAKRADAADRDCRLDKLTVEEMFGTSMFDSVRSADGHLDLPDLIAVVGDSADLGAACSSTGWVAALHWVHLAVVKQLLPASLATLATENRPPVISAVFAPQGQILTEGDGYRVSGRWTFASGAQHADWFLLSGVVDPESKVWPDIEARLVLIPRHQVEVIETWNTLGMRGTGSDDLVADGALVDRGFTSSLNEAFEGSADRRVIPLMPLLTAVAAAPVLGMGVGVLEAFSERARERITLAGQFQRDRECVRMHLSETSIELRSCRLLLEDALRWLWARVGSEGGLSIAERARVCAQSAYVVRRVHAAVDRLMGVAGANALATCSDLSRRFRDVAMIRNYAVFDFDRVGVDHGGALLGIEPQSTLV